MNYLDSLRLAEEPSLTRKSTRMLFISEAIEDGWRKVIGHASRGIYMKDHRRPVRSWIWGDCGVNVG